MFLVMKYPMAMAERARTIRIKITASTIVQIYNKDFNPTTKGGGINPGPQNPFPHTGP
jgi:hypothetical protein